MGKGVNAIFGDCAIRNRDGQSITHRIRQNRKRSALPGWQMNSAAAGHGSYYVLIK